MWTLCFEPHGILDPALDVGQALGPVAGRPHRNVTDLNEDACV